MDVCQNKIDKLQQESLVLNEKIAAGEANSRELIQSLSDTAIKIQELEAEWLRLATETDKNAQR